jgi:hypothetical protein
MGKTTSISRFKAKLLNPAKPGKSSSWAFLILPKAASDRLPRRGRTTVEGTINGFPFQATLEPDGQLSHWLKVGEDLRKASGVKVGDMIALEIAPVKIEPEPEVPSDLLEALTALPEAKVVWEDTTTIARMDWIHWIESAKQAKTRNRRVENACDMLASGKRRVCCFDQSGFYSKSLGAPEAAD